MTNFTVEVLVLTKEWPPLGSFSILPHKYLAWLKRSSQYLATNTTLLTFAKYETWQVPFACEMESATQSYCHIPECALKASFQEVRRFGSVVVIQSKE